MERLLRVLCVVVVAMLISSVASAGSLFWASPGDWTATSFGGFYPATAPSAAAGDYSYCYTNTSAAPIVVPDGQSVSVDWMHFDYYGADHGMVINGIASFGNGSGFEGLMFGNYTSGVGGYALITVNDNGELHSSTMSTYGTGGDWNIVLNGGELTCISVPSSIAVDFIGDAKFTTAKSTFDALIVAGNITASQGGTVGILADGGSIATYGIVPEPATMALLGLGALVLRRKR